HLRRLLLQVLTGRLRLTSRIVAALFSEIVLNLQKFIPNRNRPQPIRPKPHKSHAYKTAP
ncbi:MAG: hypothetical protein WBB96_09340, partial [Candidatus Dechloromonas phosphoritropha]|nr:hypothetical protein [Azonexus sp.]